MGYPALEGLLELDAPDLKGLEATHKKLKDLAKSGKTAQQKGAAAKAAAAYQRFFTLFAELTKLKNKLLAEQEKSMGPKAKSAKGAAKPSAGKISKK